MQQKRQTILLGILGVVVVGFLLWTFVFKSGDSAGNSSDQTTVTTVATAESEVVTDPAAPTAPVDPGVTDPAVVAPVPVAPEAPFNAFAYRNPFERAG